MLLLLSVTVFLATPAATTAQELQCGKRGECSGQFVGLSSESDYDGCLTACKEDNSCNYFTHHVNSDSCVHYSECTALDLGCQDCLSGQKECQPGGSEPVCDVSGFCQGDLVALLEGTTSADECLNLCQNYNDCNWFSFFAGSGSCVLTKDCTILDTSCSDCIAGERRCYRAPTFGKLLVVSGRGAETHVELVDLMAANVTCPAMPNFPFAWEGTVGAYFDGKVLVCGGTALEDSKQCHFYHRDTEEWLQTVSMGVERVYSAGVMLSETEFWITGGSGFATTELLSKNQGFSAHIDLPEAKSDHNLIKINATHFMLLGDNSVKAWMFDGGDIWTPLPDMSRPRRYAQAGLVKYSNGRLAVVVAGSYSDTKSSEIFELSEWTWRAGPDLPVDTYLHGGASVQFGDSFLIVGGYGDQKKLQKSIYAFDPSGNETWVKLEQELTEARAFFTAVLVPNDFAECL